MLFSLNNNYMNDEKLFKLTNLYLATSRAMIIIHQQNHFVTKGTVFYADHLLFERIYNSAFELSDSIGERMVGVFGAEAIEYEEQMNLLSKVLENYRKLDQSPVHQSLAIEKGFLKFSQEFYNYLKENDKLTLGLDDFIMSNASERESAVYLLQQVLK